MFIITNKASFDNFSLMTNYSSNLTLTHSNETEYLISANRWPSTIGACRFSEPVQKHFLCDTNWLCPFL